MHDSKTAPSASESRFNGGCRESERHTRNTTNLHGKCIEIQIDGFDFCLLASKALLSRRPLRIHQVQLDAHNATTGGVFWHSMWGKDGNGGNGVGRIALPMCRHMIICLGSCTILYVTLPNLDIKYHFKIISIVILTMQILV